MLKSHETTVYGGIVTMLISGGSQTLSGHQISALKAAMFQVGYKCERDTCTVSHSLSIPSFPSGKLSATTPGMQVLAKEESDYHLLQQMQETDYASFFCCY